MIALVALAAASAGAVLHPLGVYRDWVTVKDYPVEAVLAQQEGITNFALTIDANGLPQDCRITKSSGSKILDDQTCAVMLIRARFRPPVNRKGQTVAATYRQTVRWRLPASIKHDEIVDRSFDARATMAPNGNVIDCRLTGPGAARLGVAKGSCGPFGERNFIAFFLKEKYPKVRASDVRLTASFDGNPPPALTAPPSFFLVLAKAAIEVGADGAMTSCVSTQNLNALGKSIDLCDLIKTDPPRYSPQPEPRKGMMQLDLSAYYAGT